MLNLKPCPFCGCISVVLYDYGTQKDHFWGVDCDECHANTDRHSSKADAITAWNHRIGDPMTDAERHKLFFDELEASE